MTEAETPAGEILYVLIPCLDEEDNVARAASEILGHAGEIPIPLRVVLIDDGSRDGTLAAMERIAAADERCSVRRNDGNVGLGRSVLEMLEELPGEAWVTVFPGDHEFLFSSIRNFLAVRNDFDLMLGYLHNPVVRTFGRRLASYAFTKFVSTLYGFPWRYLNGMKLYRALVFQGLEVVSSGHAFMAEAIAKAQLRRPELRIGEVPFFSRGRGRGRSKAIRPIAVVRAIFEVLRGSRSVTRYRKLVVGR